MVQGVLQGEHSVPVREGAPSSFCRCHRNDDTVDTCVPQYMKGSVMSVFVFWCLCTSPSELTHVSSIPHEYRHGYYLCKGAVGSPALVRACMFCVVYFLTEDFVVLLRLNTVFYCALQRAVASV